MPTSPVTNFTEADILDSFGRIVGRKGSFTVDVPLDVALNGGTVEAPDGSIITVTPDGVGFTTEETTS